jgi:bifunctional non-homologous end joining protein LigD
MSLARYKAKRDFSRTIEPAGRSVAKRRGQPMFVIQKHAARRLHYDLRLEMDGVLKSWAVPKGIPTRQGEKRLAVQVEDHPMDYARFEGTIPEGNYGAGTVMVWDIGTFEALDPSSGLEKGKLVVQLSGRKLKGQWTLVRLRRPGQRDEKAWLLIKTDKDAPAISARTDDTSAQTGRTMKQIASRAADEPARVARRAIRSAVAAAPHIAARRFFSGAAPELLRPRSTRPRRVEAQASGAGKSGSRQLRKLPAPAPAFVEPMKALLVTQLSAEEGYLFEMKLDGIRAIGIKNGKTVRLFSRRPRELTQEYPDIVEALQKLRAPQLVVDGEIVALDEQGRSSFQLLQNRMRSGAKRPPIFFYLFDLLHFNGRDLKPLPLEQRKEMLETLLSSVRDPLRLSATLRGSFARVWQQVKRLGLEGVIAKRRDSMYEAGHRSGAWLKLKAHNEQEFVIGGYTAPQGSRKHFGAIVVGFYKGGKLMCAGKVGTGFNFASLKSLYAKLEKYRTSHCPFDNVPSRRDRSGQGITPAEMRRCVWLKPKFVCQVKFQEWTRDGNLRQPVFLGLRDDKEPEQIVRE